MPRSASVHKLHANRKESEYEERYHWDKDQGEAVRPFRLWDALNRKNLQWRFYSDKRRAQNAAFMEAKWLAVGVTIEVYDCRTMKLLGQYTRMVNTVKFSHER